MKEVNAVELRQSVSKVARTLERGGDRTQQREELVNAILADRAHTDETIEEILDAVRARR